MKTINGVQGPIDIDCLGYTLMHEHILSADWSMRQAFSDWLVLDEFIELACREIVMAKGKGIQTIVDCTPINLGRDIHAIQAVAEKTGIQIIAATGFYHTEELWLFNRSAETLAKYIVMEIEEGIQGTGIKPGIIKCATDRYGITEINNNILNAVALASEKCGIPIYTHSSISNLSGEQQIKYFIEHHINPNKVIIGHLGDTNDVEYITRILKEGCYIGLDRFGDDNKNPLIERVKTAVKLIDKGYIDKLIISHDHVCYVDIAENEWSKMRGIDIEKLPLDFCYINNKVIPLLKMYGVSEKEMEQLLFTNPRNFFNN